MAQHIFVSLVDEIDGSEADETVQFALDGVTYEIDLSAENAEELRDALAPYIEHARRAGGRKRTSSRRRRNGQVTTRSSTAEREQNQAIRGSRGTRSPTAAGFPPRLRRLTARLTARPAEAFNTFPAHPCFPGSGEPGHATTDTGLARTDEAA